MTRTNLRARISTLSMEGAAGGSCLMGLSNAMTGSCWVLVGVQYQFGCKVTKNISYIQIISAKREQANIKGNKLI